MQLFSAISTLLLASSVSSVFGSGVRGESLEKGQERKLGLRNGNVNDNSINRGQWRNPSDTNEKDGYVPITIGSSFGDKGSNPTEDAQLKDHLKELEADNNELTSRVSNLEDANAQLKSEMEDAEKSFRREGRKRKNNKNNKNNEQGNGQFPPPGNEFRAPAQGDIRSPCPAINTLANHGFINRDGKGILVGDLAQALEDIYRVRGETLIDGPIESAISLGLTVNDNGDDFLTIDQLFQNRDSRPDGSEAQEHDSSFFREDSDTGDDRLPSSNLIDDFFDFNGRAIMIPDEVMDYQRGRIQDSCARHETDSPTTTRRYTGGHRGGMAIQGALLFALGQSQGPNFNHITKSNLRSIVESETLPGNYDPTDQQLFPFDDNSQSDALRDAFRANVDKAICDFCPADLEFSCDVVAIE
mmetsp:Transcript_11026/g.19544  ORF Transcript_11026/g.19544 Transcript_11026/m.19544 type:complete len:414 (-) Transcript_11026:44-1285(-)